MLRQHRVCGPSSLQATEQTQSLAAWRGHCRGCVKAWRALTAGPQQPPQPDSHGDTWGEAKVIGKSSTISPAWVNGPASERSGEDVLGKWTRPSALVTTGRHLSSQLSTSLSCLGEIL